MQKNSSQVQSFSRALKSLLDDHQINHTTNASWQHVKTHSSDDKNNSMIYSGYTNVIIVVCMRDRPKEEEPVGKHIEKVELS